MSDVRPLRPAPVGHHALCALGCSVNGARLFGPCVGACALVSPYVSTSELAPVKCVEPLVAYPQRWVSAQEQPNA